MALEPLYTVAQLAEYFNVNDNTILRWIKEYNDTNGKKGLKAKKLNGSWRARESWVKDYARVLYADDKKGA